MTITIASTATTVKVTERDLLAFERKLLRAARSGSEREVNVVNAKRGYILYANWHNDYESPEHFASGQIALLLDGADNIATL